MNDYLLRTRSDQTAAAAPTVLLDWFASGDGSTIQANNELLAGLSPSSVAVDFLRAAAAVYCADRLSERPSTWTREIALTFPVRSGAAWGAARDDLADALGFLSGDRWFLDTKQSNERDAEPTPPQDPIDAVCLFSGGLDSFTGALDLLADGKSLCLVAHYEGGQAPRAQDDLAQALVKRFGKDRVALRRLFLRPAASAAGQLRPLPDVRETTTRSRSLLFIAAGLAVAAGFGPDVPLYIPENGFIGINVPLTQARTGSLSTRTTHPHFMEALSDCIARLGVTNAILNPFRLATKGEILSGSRDRTMLDKFASRTVSCAHPEAPRYAKRKQGNCGYCFPCLIRRAAMHHVGLDNPQDYAFDALHEDLELVADRGNDLRSLVRSLATPVRPIDVLRNGPVPSADVPAFASVYERGRAEILAWIRACGPSTAIKKQLPTL